MLSLGFIDELELLRRGPAFQHTQESYTRLHGTCLFHPGMMFTGRQENSKGRQAMTAREKGFYGAGKTAGLAAGKEQMVELKKKNKSQALEIGELQVHTTFKTPPANPCRDHDLR